MLEWLDYNDIFGLLLGDSMHPELLQRAAPIFSFLYKQGRLDEQHIELLWGTVLHKHEAVKAALLKTLSQIVQDFSSKDIQIQFERLQELQLTDFDPDIFSLLKTMCRTVIHTAYGIKTVKLPPVRRRGIIQTQRAKMVQTADDDIITSHAYRISPPKGGSRVLSEDAPRRKQRKGSLESPPDPMGRTKGNRGKGPLGQFYEPSVINLRNKKNEATVKDFTLEQSPTQPFKMEETKEERLESMAAEDKDATHAPKPEERKEQDLPQKIEQQQQKQAQKENVEEEKVTEQHFEQMEQILEFMWRLCLDESVENGLAKNVSSNAIESFEDLVFNLKGQIFEKYMQRWVEGIRTNQSAIICLRMLRRSVVLCAGIEQQQSAAPASGQDEAQKQPQEQNPQEEVLAQLRQTHNLGGMAKRPPSKRQLLIRKLCEKYDLVDIFLRSLIDFKLGAMMRATQGMALIQNEDDAEQEDEVKTQASLEGNKREEVGMDQELKQEGTSPVVRSGLSLTSTPVIDRHRPRSQDQVMVEQELITPETNPQIQRTPASASTDANILQSEGNEEGDDQDRGTAEPGQEDVQQQSSRSTDVSQSEFEEQSGLNWQMNGDLFNGLVTNQAHNLHYYQELKQRLNFLLQLFAQGDITMKQRQVQMLWDSLVVFSFSDVEKNEFFNFFAQLLQGAPTNSTGIRGIVTLPKALSQQTVDRLFYDTLLRLDFKSMSPTMYSCFERFFIFINSQFGAMLLLSQSQVASGSAVAAVRQQQQNLSGDVIEVFNIQLVGMEALWEIVLQARDSTVAQQSANFLSKLFRRLSQGVLENNIREIKNIFIETVMKQVDLGLRRIQKDSETELRCTIGDAKLRLQRAIQIIMNFLSEFQGLGGTAARNAWKGSKTEPRIATLNIRNRIQDHKGPGDGQIFQISIDLANATIGDLRSLIASKLEPVIDQNLLQITYSGDIFQDMKQSIKSTRIKEDCNIFITKEVPVEAGTGEAIYPMTKDQAQGAQKELDEQEWQNVIEQIKTIACNPGLEDNFIKYVHRKKYFDLQNTVLLFVMGGVDEMREKYEEEEEEERRQKIQEIATKENNEIDQDDSKMSVMLANRTEYFHLIFELLNLNFPEVSAPVWKLLNLIPTNTQMFEALREVQNAESPDWEALLDSNSMYKLLYSLQIVNGFIIPHQDSKQEEIMDSKEKEQWRYKFLEKGGYQHLYDILMQFEHKQENAANTAQCLAFLLKIIKVFLQAALLSDAKDNDSLRYLLLQKKPPSATHNFLLRKNSNSSYTSSYVGGGKEQSGPQSFTGQGPAPRETLVTPQQLGPPRSSDSDVPSFGGGANTPNFATSPISSKPATPPCATPPLEANRSGTSSVIQQGKVDQVQQLVEQLAKWDQTSLILKSVDFVVLVQKLFRFVAECSEEATDSDFVINALDLLLPLILYNPGLLVQLYDYKGQETTEAIVVRILTRFPIDRVRKKLETMIKIIAANISEDLIPSDSQKPQIFDLNATRVAPRVFFLKILLNNLPSEEIKLPCCDEFFSLLTGLLKLCAPSELLEIASPGQLFSTAVKRIRIRQIFQSNDPQQGPDKVMAGYLSLLNAILELQPELKQGGYTLLRQIFSYVFDLPSENCPSLPKFKKKETRKLAFQLMNSLCKGDADNYEELLLLLTTRQHNEYQNQNNAAMGDDYSIPLRSSVTNYVGLRNFGCTCYINSLLQQLFMIPKVREGVLKHKMPPSDDQRSQDFALIGAFQELFANLLLSSKQFYSPDKFIEFLRFHGQPINPRQQQDADQFLAILEDQLSSRSHFLKEVFAGELGSTLVHSISSLEEQYPYTSKREEECLRISLEIKNKKNIAQALDFFVKGDVLEGDNMYHCDEHDRKIRAVKRCYLGKLGNTVAIHLKRFEFDMTTMLRYKVNDSCEFPMRLDLRPWTEDGLEGQPLEEDEESEYLYDLVGILIHSGSSESGHYYSFIKERNTQKWFEFNDTQVKPFNTKNIKRACFGGELDSHDPGFGSLYAELYGSERTGGKPMRQNNAYLLFYQKVVPNEEEVKEAEVEDQNVVEDDVVVEDLMKTPQEIQNEKVQEEQAKKDRLQDIEEPVMEKNVPISLYEKIMEENMQYLRLRQYFDNDYIQFMKEYVNLGQEFQQIASTDPEDSDTYQFTQLRQIMKEMDLYQTQIVRVRAGASEIFSEEEEQSKNKVAMLSFESNKEGITAKDIAERLRKIQLRRTLPEPEIVREQIHKDAPFFTIKLATVFAFKVLSKLTQSIHFGNMINTLRPLYSFHAPASLWLIKYLHQNEIIYSQLLIYSLNTDIRESFCNLLKTAMRVCFHAEISLFSEFDSFPSLLSPHLDLINVRNQWKSVLQRFIQWRIINFQTYARHGWKHFTQFYKLLRETTRIHHFVSEYLINRGRMIKSLLDVLYHKRHFLVLNGQTIPYELGDSFDQPNWVAPLQALAAMFCCTMTNGIRTINKYSPHSIWQDFDYRVEVPLDCFGQIQLPLWFSEIFMNKGSVSAAAQQAVQQILEHLSWGDRDVSICYISNLIAFMFDCRGDLEKLRHPQRLIKALLKLEDDFCETRVEAVFNYTEHNITYNVLEKLEHQRYYNGFVVICLNFISDLAREFEEVKRYLEMHIDKLNWVLPFLRARDGHIQSYSRLDYEICRYPGLPKAEFLAPAIATNFCELFGQESLTPKLTIVEDEAENMDGFERSGNFIANPDHPTSTQFINLAGAAERSSDDDDEEPTATVNPQTGENIANQSITDPLIVDPTTEDAEVTVESDIKVESKIKLNDTEQETELAQDSKKKREKEEKQNEEGVQQTKPETGVEEENNSDSKQ